MAYDVRMRKMPSFMMDETTECPEPKTWTNDVRLTPEEITKFDAWADNDCPRGEGPMGWTVPRAPEPKKLDDATQVGVVMKS